MLTNFKPYFLLSFWCLFINPISTVNADVLSGTPRLACEAILCLSSGIRPGECSPAINHYYDIKRKKFSDTLRARLDFLRQCPDSSSTPAMDSLVNAISLGAGRCDAATLNNTLALYQYPKKGIKKISDQLPGHCSAYLHHELTNLGDSTPVYVGEVKEGGFWTEKSNYETALKKYQAELERRKRIRNAYGGNNEFAY